MFKNVLLTYRLTSSYLSWYICLLLGIFAEEYRAVFHLFDKNGDGKISSDELKVMMVDLGQETSDEELLQIMKSADTDSK